MNNKITDAAIHELKRGYLYNSDIYQCLFCDQQFISGNIYPSETGLVDAHKAIQLHVCEKHVSSFDALIAGDKKQSGLTPTQSEIMAHFYNGISDKEIAEITNSSPSTVRFQRYNLREKAKQAKIFLALFELMVEKVKCINIPDVHYGATMVDERYMTTDEETERIINTFFSSVNPLVLKSFSPKEKKKLVILKIIAKQFKIGKKYSEKQINETLRSIYDDYATIRRYLIEYGFMERTSDCKEYWLKQE